MLRYIFILLVAINGVLLPVYMAMGAEEEAFFDSIPTVITPTRLEQSIRDVPAATTVITQSEIRRLGLRSIPDILRLVPGMIVGEAAGNDHRLAYHSTNGQTPRRMQVLIDGMPVYGPGFATVKWDKLPIAIEDIAKIEVTRSPNSAAYGTNSMLAIVNILSYYPDEVLGYTAKLHAGSLSTKDAFLRYGGKLGNASYRMSINHQEDDGFDRNFTGIEDRRDDSNVNRFNFRLTNEFDNDSILDIHVGLVDARLEDEFEEANQQTFPDRKYKDQFLIANWSKDISDKHALQVKTSLYTTDEKQGWNTCYPIIMVTPELRALYSANPTYAQTILAGGIPTGGTTQDDILAADVFTRIAALGGVAAATSPACGDINQDINEYRYDIELQDTYIFNENLRLVSGLGIRRESISSETFFLGDRRIRDSARLFAHAEYHLNPSVTFNIGGMLEYEEEVADDTEFSPRISMNYHINNYQTIKFIVSKAVRTPDLFETARDWNYLFRNLTPDLDGQTEVLFYPQNNPDESNLVSEEILSRELIYYLYFPDKRMSFDLKLFNNKLEKLISEDLNLLTLDYTNNNSLRLKGAELQLGFQPLKRLSTRLSYAYIDNDSTDFNETSIYAEQSGSLTNSFKFNNGWIATLAYYAHLSGADNFFDYHRTDFILDKELQFNNNQKKLNFSFIVRHQDREQGAFAANPNFTAQNTYDDSTHYYFSVKYDF